MCSVQHVQMRTQCYIIFRTPVKPLAFRLTNPTSITAGLYHWPRPHSWELELMLSF